MAGATGRLITSEAATLDGTSPVQRLAPVSFKSQSRVLGDYSFGFFDLLPAAVYLTDTAGQITYFNEAAALLWGFRPELGSQWCGSWKLQWPDGSPLPHDECPMAIAI